MLNRLSPSIYSNLLVSDFYPYPIFIVIIFSVWPMNELVNTSNTVTEFFFFQQILLLPIVTNSEKPCRLSGHQRFRATEAGEAMLGLVSV